MSTLSKPRHLSLVSRDGENLLRLEGHSGALLELLNRDAGIVVRKTAADAARNARLIAQAALQRRLLQYGMPFPDVLSEGVDADGRAYFEMDYVAASNLAALLRDGVDISNAAIVKALERTLSFFRRTKHETIPAEPFRAKIDEIAQACMALSGGAPHARVIAETALRLKSLPWNGVPSSLGHGDFTLENILFAPAPGLVFVDCDGGFLSSYWLDAAKLFQDIDGEWCLRDMYMTGSDVGRARTQLDRLGRALRAIVNAMDPELAIRLPQFVALHLFRTLPYTADERLVGFVLDRIATVLDRAAAQPL